MEGSWLHDALFCMGYLSRLAEHTYIVVHLRIKISFYSMHAHVTLPSHLDACTPLTVHHASCTLLYSSYMQSACIKCACTCQHIHARFPRQWSPHRFETWSSPVINHWLAPCVLASYPGRKELQCQRDVGAIAVGWGQRLPYSGNISYK